MKSYNVIILAVVLNFCFCDDTTVHVKLKQGELSGKVKKTFLKEQEYYSFKGIPYAEPPVGTLRFKPPVAHSGWTDVYEAHVNKPTCFQFSSRMRMSEQFGMSGSEDCLYINVFTPNFKGSAPVIVFDYNDNFKTGFNGTKTYSPDFFIEENTIVVTISHRLGLLGYLTTEDDVIPPNSGLKDFIMGLKWIKDNIYLFGGDPNLVTLMGSRGGAVISDILLHSEKAKNLFSGVIMQSGTALENLFLNKNARAKALELGELLNITVSDSEGFLEELQKLDIEDIYNKESYLGNKEGGSQRNFFSFGPIIDGDLSDPVLHTFPENGKIVTDVPVIIGMNSREGLDLSSLYLFQPAMVTEFSESFLFLFPTRVGFRFDEESEAYKTAMKEILNFYFKEGYFYYGNLLEYAVYVGDMLQNYALNLAAKQLSQKMESPIFYYMFDFRGRLNENSEYISKHVRFGLQPWGATITDELCYLHLCARIGKTYKDLLKLVSKQAEIKVLKKMVRLWTNFAKTRNPTPSEDDVLQNFKWQPINKKSEDIQYLHITKNLKMKTNPLGEREKFWNNFLAKYAELAVDGVVQKQEKHEEL